MQPNDHDHGSEAVMEHMLSVLRDHIQVITLMHFIPSNEKCMTFVPLYINYKRKHGCNSYF